MSNITHADQDKVLRIQNVSNEALRNCRVGKIRLKTGVPWLDKPLVVPFRKPQPVIFGPLYNEGFQPWWTRGPWCNQAFQ